MSKRSVCVWLSGEANTKMVAELDEINEGKSNRRGDDVLTKSERCSQIIDEYYGIENVEENHQV